MEFIFIGIFGFIAMFLFDIFSMREQMTLKYFFGFLGVAIITVSTILILKLEEDLNFSNSVRISNFFMLIISFVLLIYSVFIEVGFKTTYSTDSKPKLVTNGTYALTRHPGVLWMFIVFINLFFVSGNYMILFGGIIWSIANTIYVVLQEKLIFIKIFDEYPKYQKETPMVIPTFKSIIITLKKIAGGRND